MRERGLVQLPVAFAVALLGMTACAPRDGESGAEGSDPPAALERDGRRDCPDR